MVDPVSLLVAGIFTGVVVIFAFVIEPYLGSRLSDRQIDLLMDYFEQKHQNPQAANSLSTLAAILDAHTQLEKQKGIAESCNVDGVEDHPSEDDLGLSLDSLLTREIVTIVSDDGELVTGYRLPSND